jgi:hypothetical protein
LVVILRDVASRYITGAMSAADVTLERLSLAVGKRHAVADLRIRIATMNG